MESLTHKQTKSLARQRDWMRAQLARLMASVYHYEDASYQRLVSDGIVSKLTQIIGHTPTIEEVEVALQWVDYSPLYRVKLAKLLSEHTSYDVKHATVRS
jgi:hypothetical protein